ERAAQAVKSGGVIVYPTDTIYGLGGSSYSVAVIERIYRIKSRSERKPLLVLIPEASWVERGAQENPQPFFHLAERFWPGPLTVVLKAKGDLPSALTANSGTIGVRVPQQPFTRELVRLCEVPLVSTSANVSGGETVLRVQRIIELFQPEVDL